MKTVASLFLFLVFITSSAHSASSLVNVRAELKSLRSIDGSMVGIAGIPGRFFLLYPYCVTYGDEETLSDFLSDDNPIIAAMGALCILDRHPERREEVLKRMKLDDRSVEVWPGGCLFSTMSLKALFEKIETNPDFIVPMRFRRQKPNQAPEPTPTTVTPPAVQEARQP